VARNKGKESAESKAKLEQSIIITSNLKEQFI